MNVHPMFPSLFTDEQTSVDLDTLINYAQSQRAANTDRAGGWQSAWLDLDTPELAELVRATNAHLDRVAHEVYTFPQDTTIRVVNCWINSNDPGTDQLNNNYYHMHGGYFVSCVFYVDCEPDSGNLVCVPPHGFLDYALPFQLVQQFNMFTAQRFHVQPTPGKLITFPSWINHYAEPNTSSRTRISIALNGTIQHAG